VFHLAPGQEPPVTPRAGEPYAAVRAASISVEAFATQAPSPRYNMERGPVYPLGVALSPDGDTLYTANNLADNLGIVHGLRSERRLERVDLRPAGAGLAPYPYEVVAPRVASAAKVYVSCWGSGEVVVVQTQPEGRVLRRIAVGRQPTTMIASRDGSRLYVANSGDDSVSVIATDDDRELERIAVGLVPDGPRGNTPEGLALDAQELRLFVTNAHSNSVAVVALSAAARPASKQRSSADAGDEADAHSGVLGFLPTGNYPSAVAVVAGRLFIANGKGTGFDSATGVTTTSGFAPNPPNDRFQPSPNLRGQYTGSLVSGSISVAALPDERTLAEMTRRVMRQNGLLGEARERLFRGESPIRHIIYVIKENRTYDQLFGDLERSGDGHPADGAPELAIFGAGAAARRPGGPPQSITPNQRALALRFGLLDRFFVNSEASPDGHNWATAAFSSDYVDKAFRWSYSGRGRSYDFEGFNRLPAMEPRSDAPPILEPPVSAEDIADYLRRYVPDIRGGRDVAEPETLYLWDAAARAGLRFRNYGEFVATVSEKDVAAFNDNQAKPYPDLSANALAFATKRSLEGHFDPDYRNYDLETPDAMTVDSYRAVRDAGPASALVAPDRGEAPFRGHSRLSAWLAEFGEFVRARETGAGPELPHFSIVRLSSDHTAGTRPGLPTPQFMVADNDYAVGLLVEAVSTSPYWRDTAIFVVEDDAQDGPDHVDAHRSPALVISAWNRPGALVHEFHTTVSLIRTLELLLGLGPMNQLDANAVPIDVFRDEPDLTPYHAVLPEVALDNLLNPPASSERDAYWIERSLEQNMAHADMADPRTLNEIIWYSVRGESVAMPAVVRLPAFDAMRAGLAREAEDEAPGLVARLRTLLAQR
jgi:YVTN family beta-propeller protein